MSATDRQGQRARDFRELNLLYWTIMREEALDDPERAMLRFRLSRTMVQRVARSSVGDLRALVDAAPVGIPHFLLDREFALDLLVAHFAPGDSEVRRAGQGSPPGSSSTASALTGLSERQSRRELAFRDLNLLYWLLMRGESLEDPDRAMVRFRMSRSMVLTIAQASIGDLRSLVEATPIGTPHFVLDRQVALELLVAQVESREPGSEEDDRRIYASRIAAATQSISAMVDEQR